MKKAVWAAAAATLALVSVSSQANAASCWSARAVEAAQVRDFETGMMVATLRCQIKGTDLSGHYNRFIREKRAVLTSVNDELRAKFTGQGLRGNAALNAYDRFVTSLANGYGSGLNMPSCADYQAMMSAAIEAPASRAALLNLAARAGSNPVRAAEHCAPIIASVK